MGGLREKKKPLLLLSSVEAFMRATCRFFRGNPFVRSGWRDTRTSATLPGSQESLCEGEVGCQCAVGLGPA